MTLDNATQLELDDLLGRLCDQLLEESETERLYEILAEHPAARAQYAEHLLLHGTLFCDLANQGDQSALAQLLSDPALLELEATPPTDPPAAPQPVATSPVVPLRGLTRLSNFVQQPLVFSLIFATLTAISLLLTFAQIYLPGHQGDRSERSLASATDPPIQTMSVGRLSQSVDARWSRTLVGSRITAGDRLHLLEGVAELAFSNGARLMIEGPALFEIESPMSARLHSGRLVCQVPPSAVGFEIRTPRLIVVDLGTEFEVESALNGESQVQVYSGAVEIRLSDQAVGSALRVATGQAAKFDEAQGLRLLTEEQLAGSAPRRAITRLTSGKDLIWNEDFESPQRNYQPDESPGIFNGATKWGDFYRDLGGVTDVVFNYPQGQHYFYGQCLDDRERNDVEHGTPNPPGHAISFGPLDVADYQEVELTLLLAAAHLPVAPFGAGDFLIVEAACDGGPFVALAEFRGPAQKTGPLTWQSEGEQRILHQTFERFRFALPECETVVVRIRAQSVNGSGVNEAVGIDDVRLEGLPRAAAVTPTPPAVSP